MHEYKKSYQRGEHTVIECETCGYSHLYPIPTPAQLEEFYKNQYFEEVKPEMTKEQLEEKIFWDITYEERLNTIYNLTDNQKGKILDIGCGNGLLLKFFQRQGWDVRGIEPSKTAATFAKEIGIPVLMDTFENIKQEELGLFDVVNLSFVLEHVPNPKELLEMVHKLLKPGGIACFEVPNEFNNFQMTINEVLNKEMWWISVPDHINYFNFDTLEELLKKAGLSVVHKDTSFPMELFILMGDDYVGNRELGKKVHQKRVAFENNLIKSGRNNVKRDFYQALAKIGLGRTVIMYGKKIK